VSDAHYSLVAKRLVKGRVVPFLGAGANFCRPAGQKRFQAQHHFPSGGELAQMLASMSNFPDPEHIDLLRVSQYVDAVLGERALYDFLRETFLVDYPPTGLHAFLAGLPQHTGSNGDRRPLILTTNYDDALERAFDAAGEPYELVWYEAKKGPNRGRFVHRIDAEDTVIDRPNDYDGLSRHERTTILKLHGAIDRRRPSDDPRGDSYVITEDNYIDYLSVGDISGAIPVTLREQLANTHFLFLGYSLRDWNLRVILRRLCGQQPLDLKSWAIQLAHDEQSGEIEKRLWADRGDVELLYVPLDEYVEKLAAQVEDISQLGAEAP